MAELVRKGVVVLGGLVASAIVLAVTRGLVLESTTAEEIAILYVAAGCLVLPVAVLTLLGLAPRRPAATVPALRLTSTASLAHDGQRWLVELPTDTAPVSTLSSAACDICEERFLVAEMVPRGLKGYRCRECAAIDRGVRELHAGEMKRVSKR